MIKDMPSVLKKYLNPIIYFRAHRSIYIRVARIFWGIKFFFYKKLNILDKNSKFLLSLRDKYKGRRCFVIGNGPSLKINDLKKLTNEITIASNKIYLAFKETDWRPTIYTVADLLVAENNSKEINELELLKISPKEVKSVFRASENYGKKGKHIFFRSLYKKGYSKDNQYISYFSEDLVDGAFIGQTITNLNLQIAFYLGCDPIYVIGIDGVYKIPDKKKAHHSYKSVFVSKDEENHFMKNYRKKGEAWSIPNPEYNNIEYKCGNDFIKQKGRHVYNISRHSVIDVFEKIDTDSILNFI